MENNFEIRGYTYGYGANRNDWRSERGARSQDLLHELGNNWVCLAVVNYQDTFYSTKIKFDFTRTPTDKDVAFAVAKAHEKGVKVCLKPMLNSDDHMWRAYIDFPDRNMGEKDGYWEEWFKSYTAFMVHYAELAEDLKCEMLCIGCEMLGSERKEQHWRTLIAKLRGIYSGKMVYNTNHGKEDEAKWFDALDYLGTSAYYSVGKARIGGTCTADGKGDFDKPVDKAAMKAEWEKIRERVNGVAAKLGKKYIFMEIGCRSAAGCSAMPWDFYHRDLPQSEDEQAAFYETCLETFAEEPQFAGVFWWDWSTFVYDTPEEAAKDIGFNIHLKKAEKILKEYYAR
ncbi:MAG: glycosyl hydrolase family 53 [Oscillospiraceae bacterium]|nr:glycosyl hydrolase family 53 [Oscillospiraceae bacterium]